MIHLILALIVAYCAVMMLYYLAKMIFWSVLFLAAKLARCKRRYTISHEGMAGDLKAVGESVKQWWGKDDYEFWVDVPAKALPKLVFVLMREKYGNQRRAVDQFKEFCERENIEHKWGSWLGGD